MKNKSRAKSKLEDEVAVWSVDEIVQKHIEMSKYYFENQGEEPPISEIKNLFGQTVMALKRDISSEKRYQLRSILFYWRGFLRQTGEDLPVIDESLIK